MLANARLEQMRRSGDDWLLTSADGRTLRAPLVIAADGANSAVTAPDWRCDSRVGLSAPRHRHQRAQHQAASIDGVAALSPITGRWRFCRWNVMGSRIGARSSGRPPRAKLNG
jgi:2-polyprenyl-6-methoxyphenol hydroxylase-like FAD-dependent oxidoreductase